MLLDLPKHVLFWHSWGLPKLVNQNLFFSESQTKTSTKTRIVNPRRKQPKHCLLVQNLHTTKSKKKQNKFRQAASIGISACLARICIKSTVCRVWYEHTIRLQFFLVSCENLNQIYRMQSLVINKRLSTSNMHFW